MYENLEYEDNVDSLADRANALQKIINKMNESTEKLGMKRNIKNSLKKDN